MKKMNIPLMATLLALSIIVCPILYFSVGPILDSTQLEVRQNVPRFIPGRKNHFA